MTSISTGHNNNNNNNDVLKTNKQTNKQRLQGSRIYKGLFFNDTEEDIDLLERLEVVRRRDGSTFSDFVKTALTAYVNYHYPGNPGLPLDHWTKGEPLSQAAREKIDAASKQSDHPKPILNVKAMNDRQLLLQYNSSDTDIFDLQLIALELKRRGRNLEDLHREKAHRRYG